MRALAVAAVLAAASFSASEAEAAYAAIAFSQSHGSTGYWYGAPSRAAAEARALRECGSGCSVVIWTQDACAALAVGRGNGYGTYWSTSQAKATSGALSECARRTTGCRIAAYACSG